MSRIFRDSRGDTLSTTPPNVTNGIVATGSVSVVSDSAALETDRVVQISHDGGNRQLWTFDEFNSITDFEAVFRVKHSEISANAVSSIWFRQSGTSGSPTGYLVEWDNTNLKLRQAVAGVYSDIATVSVPSITANGYFWINIYCNGSNLDVTLWLDGEEQPDNANIFATNSAIATAGAIGLSTSGSSTYTASIDMISVGNQDDGSHDIGLPCSSRKVPRRGYLTSDDTLTGLRWVTDGYNSKKSFYLIRRDGVLINSVAVHNGDGRILVAYGDDTIWSYDREGLNGVEVHDNSGNGAVENMSIDEANSYVFYESNSAEIRRIDYGTWANDQSVVTVANIGQIQAHGGSLWYYANGSVHSAGLDGSSPTAELSASGSIAFEIDDTHWYIRNTSTGLRKIDRATGLVDTQLSSDVDFLYLAYNETDGRVAWVDGTADDINDVKVDATDEQQRAAIPSIYGETLTWFSITPNNYQTDFKGYNLRERPLDITGEWYAATSNLLRVDHDNTLDSTKYLHWKGRGQITESFFSFDDIGDPGTERVQQYSVFQYDSLSTDGAGFRHIYRGSGGVGSKNGAIIFTDLFGDGRIMGGRFVSNTITFIGTSDETPAQEVDTDWNMLTEVNGSGTNATLRGKLWKGTAADEPIDWMYDEVLGATLDSGKVGLGMYQEHSTTFKFKYHSIGVGEDAARQSDLEDTKPAVGLGANKWEKGCEITINSDKIGGTSGVLEEFRLVLGRSAFPDNAITSGHADVIDSSELRFIDSNGFLLPSDVVRWDLNADPTLSRVRVHVKVNGLAKNTDTKIRAIWGYNGTVPTIADNTEFGKYSSTSKLKASLPIAEDPNSDATDAILDRTQYQNHGTTVGSMVLADLVEIGTDGLQGLDFNGTSQAMDIQDFVAGFDDTDLSTFYHYARSCVMRMDGQPSRAAVISKHNSSGGNLELWLQGDNYWNVTFDGAFDDDGATAAPTDEEFHHFYLSVDFGGGSSVQWKLYVDGVKVIDQNFTAVSGADEVSTNGWTVMQEWDLGSRSDWNDGVISSIDFFDTQNDTIDEELPATLYEMFLNPSTFYTPSQIGVAGAIETTVSTAVALYDALVAGRTVYHTINVTGDLTYDMSAYVDVEIEEGVLLRALAGFTNKPEITYSQTFADNTFQGLFRPNTGSIIENLRVVGQHANDVADGVVQNAFRFIGANVQFRNNEVVKWCKWGLDLEVNQGHIIEDNFFEECWWSSDANDDGFEFGGYGYAIWLRGALTNAPATADVTIIRRNKFNNCRNFIDAGSQAGNSVIVRNNQFGYASQAAMDSHSGGYYKCEVSGNWFLNRRSGQSSMRIQDVQTHVAGGYLLIENNVDVDGTNVWYFGPTTSGALNESDQLWPPSGDIFEPDAINWDGVTPGQDYAVVDIQNNLFRQNAWEPPYDEHGRDKVLGMRATTAGALWDWEDDSPNDRLMVLPNSRATQPNFVLAGTSGYTSGWTFGRALSIPAGSANNATIANANCGNIQMGTGSISVTIKAKQVTNTVAFASLFHFGASSGNEAGYSVFWKNNGELLARFSNGTVQEQDTIDSTLALDTWYTITVIFDRELEQIRGYIDGVLTEAHNFSAGIASTEDIQCTQPLEIGTGFQNDGHFEIDFIQVDKRVIAQWEIDAYHNGGNSIKSKSEIFLGNWDVNNTDVIKQRFTIDFGQVGGLRPHRAISLNITEDQFHEVWKDGDHPTGLNLVTNDPKLRFAVVRHDAPNVHTGIWQIPFKVNALTIDNNPSLSNIDIDLKLIDFHNGTSLMDGLRGHEVYAWRGPAGTVARATDGPYGSDAVDVAVSNLTTDETTTDTNENTPNTFWGAIETPTYGNDDSISGLSAGSLLLPKRLIMGNLFHL